MKIAMTGVTGNMGREALKEVLKIHNISVKILVLNNDKRIKNLLKENKDDVSRIEVIKGNIKDIETCKKLVKDVSYVVNMAAVIPPKSDKHPEWAIDCNELGVKALIDAIEETNRNIKLIHISTVALYGNRNHLHPWGGVGDPLLISPFDIYSLTKLRGELSVLESGIANWVVLRQSAMLHKRMLTDNVSDGLMFHTCFSAPLEWVTAHDSGVLIANIIKKDVSEDLSKVFWKKVFDIGSLPRNRILGSGTFNDGFKLIGGSNKDFFKPYFNATRNFHGVWFYDGMYLDELFNYQSQSVDDYWKEVADTHKYYKLAKILPKGLIRKFVIERLFKDDNSIRYWYKHNDEARMMAYFGGKDKYEALPKTWDNFNLLDENKTFTGEDIDFKELQKLENAKISFKAYEFNKNDDEITIDDLREVAKAHGGELLGEYNGDLYEKLTWKTQDNEIFMMSAFSVLRAGHWHNSTYYAYKWDFDRLAKKDKIFADIWYDSHDQNENVTYYYDDKFKACMDKI